MKYLHLIRIKHWAKNTFLFLPLFFGGEFLATQHYVPLMIAFFAFGLVASTIYIINDLKDIDHDKLHPKKSARPLASGEVSKQKAKLIASLLLVIGLLIALQLSIKFTFILGLYFFLNLAYTFWLKNISILDIIIVSIGFVLRVKAGSIITEIPLSHWIVLMIFLLALFMAIAKRRDDTILKTNSGINLRTVTNQYNLDYLNIILTLVSGVIIVSYIMYTLSSDVILRMGTYRLYYTSLFVIAGILRYLQITLVENNSGSPTAVLYKDRFIQICLLLWTISFYLLIYFKDLTLF